MKNIVAFVAFLLFLCIGFHAVAQNTDHHKPLRQLKDSLTEAIETMMVLD